MGSKPVDSMVHEPVDSMVYTSVRNLVHDMLEQHSTSFAHAACIQLSCIHLELDRSPSQWQLYASSLTPVVLKLFTYPFMQRFCIT